MAVCKLTGRNTCERRVGPEIHDAKAHPAWTGGKLARIGWNWTNTFDIYEREVVAIASWFDSLVDWLPNLSYFETRTMLYLGIDQHARQLTSSLRDDSGDVLQARQVSTRPEKIQTFFTKLTRERLRDDESFIAVVEVCGFNDWLIKMLAAQARV